MVTRHAGPRERPKIATSPNERSSSAISPNCTGRAAPCAYRSPGLVRRSSAHSAARSHRPRSGERRARCASHRRRPPAGPRSARRQARRRRAGSLCSRCSSLHFTLYGLPSRLPSGESSPAASSARSPRDEVNDAGSERRSAERPRRIASGSRPVEDRDVGAAKR